MKKNFKININLWLGENKNELTKPYFHCGLLGLIDKVKAKKIKIRHTDCSIQMNILIYLEISKLHKLLLFLFPSIH